MSQEEVRNLLGEPEGCFLSEESPDLEIRFSAGDILPIPEGWKIRACCQCHCYFHDPEGQFLLTLSETCWLAAVPRETTFGSVPRCPERFGHPGRSALLTHGPDQELVLQSAVRVNFGEGLLYSVNYTLRRESEFKQVSLEIPRAHLKAIQQEATASGLSVPKLCARWIEEPCFESQAPVELGSRTRFDR